MDPKLESLQNQINTLQTELNLLKSSTTIPKDVDSAFRARFKINDTLTAVSTINSLNGLDGYILGDATGSYSATIPLSGVRIYYVSDTSGGLTTRKLTFTDGILTSQT